jgi:hypothetical protein
MHDEDLSTRLLAARVTRLERQNRLLRGAGAACLALAVLAAVGAAGSRAAAAQTGMPGPAGIRSLEATRLVLHDMHGHVRAVLDTAGDETFLVFYDGQARERLRLAWTPEGATLRSTPTRTGNQAARVVDLFNPRFGAVPVK